MISILFVCRGNVFRSFLAMYYAKYYVDLYLKNNIKVDSAGTEAANYSGKESFENLKLYYKEKGVVFQNHIQKKITKEILKSSDIIISMDKHVQKHLKNDYGFDSVLFNKIAFDNETSIVNYHSKEKFEYVRSRIEIGCKNIVEKLKS